MALCEWTVPYPMVAGLEVLKLARTRNAFANVSRVLVNIEHQLTETQALTI